MSTHLVHCCWAAGMSVLLAGDVAAQVTWVPQAPVNAIAPHPTDPDILYAGRVNAALRTPRPGFPSGIEVETRQAADTTDPCPMLAGNLNMDPLPKEEAIPPPDCRIDRGCVIVDWGTGELLPRTTTMFRAMLRRRAEAHWTPVRELAGV